jgi:hypothetical protein
VAQFFTDAKLPLIGTVAAAPTGGAATPYRHSNHPTPLNQAMTRATSSSSKASITSPTSMFS